MWGLVRLLVAQMDHGRKRPAQEMFPCAGNSNPDPRKSQPINKVHKKGRQPIKSSLAQRYKTWLALVAHIYNPSYSGGRDQEDHG
jgi:hypothetical protein